MDYAKKAQQANKPGDYGYPFGDFVVQLLKVEEEDRPGKGGTEQTYFDWHLLMTKKRHESAQGSVGTIGKVSFSWNIANGSGNNTAFGAALAGKTFEEFQALEKSVINAYFTELQDAEKQADKKRTAILQVRPRHSEGKVYRDYSIYPANADVKIYEFDPKTAETSSGGSSASGEAGKGTATRAPGGSGL